MEGVVDQVEFTDHYNLKVRFDCKQTCRWSSRYADRQLQVKQPNQTTLSQTLPQVTTLNTWKFHVEHHVNFGLPLARQQHLTSSSLPCPHLDHPNVVILHFTQHSATPC